MDNFTPIPSLLGGILIGLSAAGLMLSHGRIAGISSIVSSALNRPKDSESPWRLAFVAGLVAGGALMAQLLPEGYFEYAPLVRSHWSIAAAGLLVGLGTVLGSGCTSGHGICGLGRFQPRSLVATLTFMATGVVAATIVTQLFAGTL